MTGYNPMNDDLNHAPMGGGVPRSGPTFSFQPSPVASSKGWPQAARWLSVLVAALLWLTFVYGLSLQALRESHRIAKDDLARLLQTAKPEVPEVLDAFDHATEQILFSVLAPHLVLTLSAFFFVAHLAAAERRLKVVECSLRALRDVVIGVEGVPLR